ncbi:uncharacterized protein LOC112088843 [Eutrema salsugineum]|uniref:uncharacterized protein LOC112088843 n=1 Tax=Eutrema salsugineum TaxID=72664 RepID=UPI000CECFD0B|nr:uncharacterized protein LOC112088843 [Eutrema salsugineum]
MTIYSSVPDPTEQAARKERVRQAEESGQLLESAVHLAQSNLKTHEHTSLALPLSSERIPVSLCLGPINPESVISHGEGQGILPLPPPKRKPGRPPGSKKPPRSPLPLAKTSTKIRKVRRALPPKRKHPSESSSRGSDRTISREFGGPSAVNPLDEVGSRDMNPYPKPPAPGLGNPLTAQRVRNIRRKLFPDILFLSETKNADAFILNKLKSLKYDHHHLVPPHDICGGGLPLFWKQDLNLEIISSCANYIDTSIRYEGKLLFITLVHGDPERSKRKAVWDSIISLSSLREAPWFLTGDFNDILDNSEK